MPVWEILGSVHCSVQKKIKIEADSESEAEKLALNKLEEEFDENDFDNKWVIEEIELEALDLIESEDEFVQRMMKESEKEDN